MYIMGTNTWDFEGDTEFLVESALEFADEMKANGIAKLRDACIAPDQKRLWCTWETEDLEGLQTAFDEMNTITGLSSELTEVDIMYP